VRDSRIAMIYEGTNEIQAIDLVMRKLLGRGQGLALLLEEFRRTSSRCQAAAHATGGEVASCMARISQALHAQAQETERAVTTLAEARNADPEAPVRVADDVLHAMGHALMAWAWARIATAAVSLESSAAQRERLDLCAFGIDWLLPAAQWRWHRIASWRTHLPWLPEAAVR